MRYCLGYYFQGFATPKRQKVSKVKHTKEDLDSLYYNWIEWPQAVLSGYNKKIIFHSRLYCVILRP